MKCQLCDVLISQADANRAAEFLPPNAGHETLCPACAMSLVEAEYPPYPGELEGEDYWAWHAE